MANFKYVGFDTNKVIKALSKESRSPIKVQKQQAVTVKSAFSKAAKPTVTSVDVQAPKVETPIATEVKQPDAVIGTPVAAATEEVAPENIVAGASFEQVPADIEQEEVNPFAIAENVTPEVEALGEEKAEEPALSVDIPTTNTQETEVPIAEALVTEAPVITAVETPVTENKLADHINTLSEEAFIIELKKLMDMSPIKYQVLRDKLELEAKLILNDQKYVDQVERGKAELGDVGRDVVNLAQAVNQQALTNQVTAAGPTLTQTNNNLSDAA